LKFFYKIIQIQANIDFWIASIVFSRENYISNVLVQGLSIEVGFS